LSPQSWHGETRSGFALELLVHGEAPLDAAADRWDDEEAETGMSEMSETFEERGGEICLPAAQ